MDVTPNESVKASDKPPSRGEILSWCCFDFANSSYTTVIITVVFAPWFVKRVAAGRDDGATLWGWALALSQLLVVLLGPVLGSLADQTGRKKWFLAFSAMGCIVPTLLLGLTDTGTVALALLLVVFSNFCFSLGENFTASFLPELSTPETCGRISGYGWAFGYFGGLASLALALWMIQGQGLPANWTFVMTGVFFAVAALPTFLFLRERAPRRPWPPAARLVDSTWGETVRFLKALPSHRELFRFLLAFFCFMTGVCAVIAYAGIYAEQEFNFDTAGVIKLFICLQLTAAAGAFAFGFVQDKLGARPALSISLLGWCLVALGAWKAQTQAHFYAVSVLAGLVIGSTQSASRALVSALTDPGREGETFGYWGLFGKLAAVVGTAGFGMLVAAFGLRHSMLFTLGSFACGLALLLSLRLAQREAR